MNSAFLNKEGSAALDIFPAYCCLLFKRSNALVCAEFIYACLVIKTEAKRHKEVPGESPDVFTKLPGFG